MQIKVLIGLICAFSWLLPASANDSCVAGIDIKEAKDLAYLCPQIRNVCDSNYPLVCQFLSSPNFVPPAQLEIVIKAKLSAPAYTSGNKISASAKWLREHPDDLGMFVHEMTHSVQAYSGGYVPGWLTEGIADYVRFRFHNGVPVTEWCIKCQPNESYTSGYRCTAKFLLYIEQHYDHSIVPKLNALLRQQRFNDDFWMQYTGQPLAKLWADFSASPDFGSPLR